MTQPVSFLEIWRGGYLESQHLGHAVVCDARGEIVEAWGDPGAIIFPRSSCKILQALPLVESGAADAAGLSERHLAIACASHQGAAIHTDLVGSWLSELGLGDDDLRCGAQKPSDEAAAHDLVRRDQSPCQMHNNCSGKHSGFLTLSQHLRGGPDYVELDHPVQLAVKDAFEQTTGMAAQGHGIDGCSAPNFRTSVQGLARAMAKMAAPSGGSTRDLAAQRLVQAAMTFPELVAGEGRACTELMRAAKGKAAIKTGAEAVFVGILPEKGLGIALKIADGTTRAAEAAIAGLLVKYGAVDRDDPMVQKRLYGPIKNWRGMTTGHMRLSDGFLTL